MGFISNQEVTGALDMKASSMHAQRLIGGDKDVVLVGGQELVNAIQYLQ